MGKELVITRPIKKVTVKATPNGWDTTVADVPRSPGGAGFYSTDDPFCKFTYCLEGMEAMKIAKLKEYISGIISDRVEAQEKELGKLKKIFRKISVPVKIIILILLSSCVRQPTGDTLPAVRVPDETVIWTDSIHQDK